MAPLALKGPDTNDTPATGEWMTLVQAAALLQVSKRTMARLVSPEAGRDRIPAARFGGSVRIRRVTLDRYLERRTA